MTNKEATQRFDGYTHGTFINKLFWIAGSFDNLDLKDMLMEMDLEDYKKSLPLIANSKHFKDYREDDEITQALVDHNYFGLIAELHHPRCHNFRYNEKKEIVGCAVSLGSCRISYVYAENLKDLMNEIEKSATIIYNEYVQIELELIK